MKLAFSFLLFIYLFSSSAMAQNTAAHEEVELQRIERLLAEDIYHISLNADEHSHKELKELSQHLAKISVRYSTQYSNLGFKKNSYHILKNIWSNILDFVNLPQALKHAEAHLNHYSKGWGKELLFAYIAMEIAERFLAPMISYRLGGEWGLLMTPWIHLEYISIPLFISLYFIKDRWRKSHLLLSDSWFGSFELYKKILNFKNSLLGFRHKMRTASFQWNKWSFEIYRSRFPIWFPKWMRKVDEQRMHTSEAEIPLSLLEDIINETNVIKVLRKKANNNISFYSVLLLEHIHQNPWMFSKLNEHLYLIEEKDLKQQNSNENWFLKHSNSLKFQIQNFLNHESTHLSSAEHKFWWSKIYELERIELRYARLKSSELHSEPIPEKEILNQYLNRILHTSKKKNYCAPHFIIKV